MPLRINYAASPLNKENKKAFLSQHRIIYGRNELHAWAYNQGDDTCKQDTWLWQKRGFKSASRISDFHMSEQFLSNVKPFELNEKLYEIHEWLSENISSPWLMQDSLTQNGFNCFIHIERADECALFDRYKNAHYPGYEMQFFPSERTPEQITDLAIIKGVVAPYSQMEDYETWIKCNYGFYEDRKIIDEKLFHAIILEREDLKDLFQRDLVDTGIYAPDETGIYLCASFKADLHASKIMAWKSNFTGIITMPKGPEGLYMQRLKDQMPFGSLIAFNHQATEEAFKENWGSHFQYNKEYNYYTCSKEDFPQRPERAIPQAFTDYLNGKGPDPSLKLKS